MTRKRLILAVLLVLAVAAGIWLSSQAHSQLPAVQFTDIDGDSHQLADYQDKPVLMIFWATDCPGCIQEIPDLIALHEEYGDKLAMVGVAMSYDNPAHIKKMREQKGLPYLITWDESNEISQAFGNVRVTPTHFLANPEGEIIMRKIGVMDKQTIRDKLARMGVSPT